MTTARDLVLGQPGYPRRLAAADEPPEVVSVEGDLGEGLVVAIVGARRAAPDAADFAFALAEGCARAGAVVVSGGAIGIDAAAHRGALAAGGRTWAVAPTGRAHTFPKEHEALYRTIAAGSGAMIWPFSPGTRALPQNFLRRNRVLVALADVVVVVQADFPSGALNAARWAKKLGRPLWAVLAAPWVAGFRGCAFEIERGARPLTSIAHFLSAAGLPVAAPRAEGERPRTAAENAVFRASRGTPLHVDELVAAAALPVGAAMTALLTLSLEHVLVEGPEGFFRRSHRFK